MATNNEKLQKLIEKREQALAGGGAAAVEKHHAKGAYSVSTCFWTKVRLKK